MGIVVAVFFGGGLCLSGDAGLVSESVCCLEARLRFVSWIAGELFLERVRAGELFLERVTTPDGGWADFISLLECGFS